MKLGQTACGILFLFVSLSASAVETEIQKLTRKGEEWKPKLLATVPTFPGLIAVVGDFLFYSDWKGDQGHCRGKMVYRRALEAAPEGEEAPGMDLHCVTSMFADESGVYVAYDGENQRSGVKKFLPSGQLDDVFAQRFAESLYEWDRFVETSHLEIPNRKANWTLSHGILWRVQWLKQKTNSFVIQRWPIAGGPGEAWVREVKLVDEKDRLFSELFLKVAELGEVVVVKETLFVTLSDPSSESEFLSQIVTLNLSSKTAGPVLGNLVKQEGEAKWLKKSLVEWWGRKFRYLAATEEGVIIPDLTDFADEEAAISYYQAGAAEVSRVQLESRGIGGIFFLRGELYVSKPNAKEIWKFSQNK